MLRILSCVIYIIICNVNTYTYIPLKLNSIKQCEKSSGIQTLSTVKCCNPFYVNCFNCPLQFIVFELHLNNS